MDFILSGSCDKPISTRNYIRTKSFISLTLFLYQCIKVFVYLVVAENPCLNNNPRRWLAGVFWCLRGVADWLWRFLHSLAMVMTEVCCFADFSSIVRAKLFFSLCGCGG